MALNELRNWLHFPYENAQSNAHVHRRLLVVNGNETFVDEQATALLAQLPAELTVNTFDSAKLKGKNRQNLLGNEWDIAILDCRSVFRPSILMAVAGTVKKNGCLVLLCPDLEKWPNNVNLDFVSFGYEQKYSRYLRYFVTHLKLQPWVCFHNENETIIPDNTELAASTDKQNIALPFTSADQQKAFAKLLTLYNKKALNATITAPRGRGKSSLLGLFTVHLLKQGQNILLTSSNIENIANILQRLPFNDDDQRLTISSRKTRLELDSGTLQWVAPDDPRLVNDHDEQWDILIVDEAASIPLPSLQSFISHHHHWLLSTTLQGYEGSGSGFMLKLMPTLESNSNTVSHITLTSPIRWYDNDLLECFLTSHCLFNSSLSLSPKRDDDLEIQHAVFSIEEINRLSLEDVSSIMQLLTSAHYQTTPDDFMRIYDSPETLLAVLRIEHHIVAACIVNKEGGEKLAPLASDIANGKRRPKGHLGAQRLALLSANKDTALLNYWRINRIAVIPHLQSLGLGSNMLKQIIKEAQSEGVDAVSTSYGATQKLHAFWEANKFSIVDTGRKPNKASGETSAMALLPLTHNAHALTVTLQHLQTAISASATFSSLSESLRTLYIKKVLHFASGYRQLGDAQPYLIAIAHYQRANAGISEKLITQDVLSALTSGMESVHALQAQLGASGIKELQAIIRKSIDSEKLASLMNKQEL
ncbi:MAG: GNAT family N-acetyltransferase [Pseudomonadota bacterium]|nr:GNAT family N-acetyltransferase [Pseudomonadota bacterium]